MLIFIIHRYMKFNKTQKLNWSIMETSLLQLNWYKYVQ